jgi:hypothetical protein
MCTVLRQQQKSVHLLLLEESAHPQTERSEGMELTDFLDGPNFHENGKLLHQCHHSCPQ